MEFLSKAQTFVRLDERVEKRAAEFVALGIKPLDALRRASAEEGGVVYFCTRDDRLLRKAKAVADLRTRPVSLVELIEELEP